MLLRSLLSVNDPCARSEKRECLQIGDGILTQHILTQHRGEAPAVTWVSRSPGLLLRCCRIRRRFRVPEASDV